MTLPSSDIPCTPNPDVAGRDVSIFRVLLQEWSRADPFIQTVIAFLVTSSLIALLALVGAFGKLQLYVAEQRRIIRDDARYHRTSFIDKFLLGLSVTQLVAGIAMMVAIWNIYGPSSELSPKDPHAHLARDMMLANLFSGVVCHFAVTMPPFPWRALLHWLLFFAFTIAVLIAEFKFDQRSPGSKTAVIITAILLIAGFAFLPQFFMKGRWRWLGGALVLLPSFFTTGYFVVRTGQIKFRGSKNFSCDLNTPEDNQSSFGQYLALALIIQIPLSFIDAIESRRSAQRKLHGYAATLELDDYGAVEAQSEQAA